MSRGANAKCDDERFQRIDAAFRAGDLSALRAAVSDPGVIPNGPMPIDIGPCLAYAIYHSPFAFVVTLLELGADPNPPDHDGFPPIIAALVTRQPHPGATLRADALDIVRLLVARGADVNQRGLNDYTPLHWAVDHHDAEAVTLLLDLGADPRLRTRIDGRETPLELAQQAGLDDLVRLLAARTPVMTSPLSSRARHE